MNLNSNQTNHATNGVITKCISTATYPLFDNFLTMVKAMFSKGNSGEAVDVASNLFKLQQEPDEAHPSAFLERVKDQLPQFTAHFEDKAHPGYVKITRIEVAIIHGGLRLSQPANIAAIRDHLKDNPTNALDKPSELRETIQRAHKSGLYPDEPSTQSSAFVSTSTPNKATVLLGDLNKPHSNSPKVPPATTITPTQTAAAQPNFMSNHAVVPPLEQAHPPNQEVDPRAQTNATLPKHSNPSSRMSTSRPNASCIKVTSIPQKPYRPMDPLLSLTASHLLA